MKLIELSLKTIPIEHIKPGDVIAVFDFDYFDLFNRQIATAYCSEPHDYLVSTMFLTVIQIKPQIGRRYPFVTLEAGLVDILESYSSQSTLGIGKNA